MTPEDFLEDQFDDDMIARKLAVERMFEMDLLSESLTTGRLCGQAVDPVTAELMMVLLERLHWVPQTRQLAAAMPHFPDGFGVTELRATFANLGFPSTDQWLPGRQLAGLPAETLVCDPRGEMWLVRQDGKRPVLVQPSETEERTRRIRTTHLYRCFHFERQHADQPDGMSAATGTGWMTGLILRFSPEVRLLVLLTLLSGASAILIAFGLTKIFDTVIPTRNIQTLEGIILGLLLIFGADFTLRQIRASIIGRLSGRVEYLLGSALLGKLLHLPSQRFDGVPLSDQMAQLRQFETIRDLFGGPVVLLLLEYPLVVVMLLTIALMAWPLALVLTGLIVLFGTLGALLAPAVRRTGKAQSAAQTNLNRSLFEILGNRRQIGREGLADHWIGRIERQSRELAHCRRRQARSTRWLEGLAYASLPLSAASVIGLGAVLVMQGSVTAGQLVATTILTWRLFAPIQQTLKLLPKLQDVQGLFGQIDALMRLPEEQRGAPAQINAHFEGNLETRGLVLRHPKSFAPTLVNVQLEIPHGSLVALTGRSGSGKTTLLRLLAGQLAPQAGGVLLNRLHLTQLSRDLRASKIAYVSQKPIYLYGSVAQNLRLADPSADDQHLQNILEEVGLGAWVTALPEGIHTRLDPNVDGHVLTASVRACIAVAQAFLSKPVVLLLDEPAGGMDQNFETHLLAALEARRGSLTCVIVTHRPSLMRRTDSVIFLNGGNAVMRATADLEQAAS
ncbi:MAG: ABC transporter transmembrane domain-containing protein [Silicimonas sp.]|nr:ABC transporter transmembrane domain-containing protein [Silicimonas sp.]